MALPPNIVSIVAVTSSNEVYNIPIEDFIKTGDGKGFKHISEDADSGQISFLKYKSSRAFSGRAIGLLAHDSEGNIISYPLLEKTSSSSSKTVIEGTFDGTPFTLPVFSESGKGLDSSTIYKNGDNYGIDTEDAGYKWEIQHGSTNIKQYLSTGIPDDEDSLDGYRINGKLVVNANSRNNTVTIGSEIYRIVELNSIQFDMETEEDDAVGKLVWNDSDGTLNLGLKGGTVSLQIGQELVKRVVNKTGVDLLESEYKVVYISGAQGQKPKIAFAKSDEHDTSDLSLGVVTEDIDKNQEGFITTSGGVHNINTTGALQGETWSEGDLLYLSDTVDGGLTNIMVDSPSHQTIVGRITYKHNNKGHIDVSILHGTELSYLHDVHLESIADNDVLYYNLSTSLWENTSVDNLLGITQSAWLLDAANELEAKDYIGSSVGDYDIGIKRNDVEVALINQYGLSVLDGSESNPSMSFMNSLNTGLWLTDISSYKEFHFGVNGREAFRIDETRLATFKRSISIFSELTWDGSATNHDGAVLNMGRDNDNYWHLSGPRTFGGENLNNWGIFYHISGGFTRHVELETDGKWTSTKLRSINEFYDSSDSSGTSGQFLKSGATTTSWADFLLEDITDISTLLTNLNDLTTFDGFLVTDISGNVYNRTLNSGTGISITNDSGVAGNPQINVIEAYVQDLIDASQVSLNYWVKSVNDLYYTAGKVMVGTTTNSGANLTVLDSIHLKGVNPYFEIQNNFNSFSLFTQGATAPESRLSLYANAQVIAAFHPSGTTTIGSTIENGYATLEVTGSISQSSVISSILKTNSNGVLVAATDGVEYVSPTWISNNLSLTNYWVKDGSGNLSYDGGGATTVSVSQLLQQGSYLNALMMVNGSGTFVPADNQRVIEALDSSGIASLNYWTKSGSNLSYSLGNVGIGTTTAPDRKLVVNGDIGFEYNNTGVSANGVRLNGLYTQYFNNITSTGAHIIHNFTGSGFVPKLVILEGGNVGIGTITPLYKLEVNGDSLINGLIVGRGSGNSTTNSVLGNTALNANTTGVYNVAVGFTALNANITGLYNTAIGAQSLHANTTGGDNTAVGLNALYKSTGSGNTAIGSQIMFSNTIGAYNTALGYQAMYTSVNSSYNTALGGRAGFDNVTGGINVFLGYNSGLGITTGSNNTIIGANITGLSSSLSDTMILGAGARQDIVATSIGVGVGTATPITKLEVYGGHGDTKFRLYSVGDSGGSDSSLDMWASAPGVHYRESGIGSNINGHPFYGVRNSSYGSAHIAFLDNTIIFSTDNTKRIYLNNIGYVGIGRSTITSSAGSYELQVNGTIQQETVKSKLVGTDPVGGLIEATSGMVTSLLGAGSYIQNQTSTYQTGGFKISSTGTAISFIAQSSTGVGYSVLNTGTSTNSGYLELVTNGTGRRGYIGFHALHMHYVAENGARHYFSGGDMELADPVSRLLISYNGTSSYRGTLGFQHLQLGNNGENRIIAGNSVTGGSLSFYVNNTTEIISHGTSSNGIKAMTIKNNGYVGINTSTPSDLLHVNGVIRWGGESTVFAYSGIDTSGLYIEQFDDGSGKGQIRLQSRVNNSGSYTAFYVDGNNEKFQFVNGSAGTTMLVNSTSIQSFVNSYVYNSNGSADGYIALISGNNSHAGYIQFYKPGGTITGYIGWDVNNMFYYAAGGDHSFINGNVLIGGLSSLGSYKLQVINGDAIVQGYIRQTANVNSMLKATSDGTIVGAVAGTDFVSPSGLGSYVPTSRTLSINGTTYDLTANRSWTITGSKWTDSGSDIYRSSRVAIGNSIITAGDVNWDNMNLQVKGGVVAYQTNSSGWFTRMSYLGIDFVNLSGSKILGLGLRSIASYSDVLTLVSNQGHAVALFDDDHDTMVGVRGTDGLVFMGLDSGFSVTTTYAVYVNSGGDTSDGLYIRGSIYTTDNMTFGSDRRLKKNITPIRGALNSLRGITPSKYLFRDNKHSSFGFIAQDVAEQYDFLVKKKNGDLTLDYNGMVALVAQGVRENDERIKELEEEVVVLRKEISSLNAA